MHSLKRTFRRLSAALDAAFARLYGWEYNPLHQPGTIAVAMLVILLVTGLYLIFLYRVGSPAESVARLAADPWLGGWIRSVHRYASDLFVVAALYHALRMFAQNRSWGPRTLAWVSGVSLFGIGLICAWTGFVMAWDSFGERLAREGARLFDVLPVLSEPLSRIFSGTGPVPSAFFFVNLFLHIAIPLGMGIGLWLHLSRIARPVLLPPRRIFWGLVAALVGVAVVLPAPLGPAADPLILRETTPLNLITAWWLPISEQLPAWVVWLVGSLGVTLVILIPRFTHPGAGLTPVSVVDPKLCTGCNQCPQDCPWEAITMVPREDDRPSLVAQIDPSRCVSCGICAGSCAPMGVGPPGRSGRDQLLDLRSGLLPALEASRKSSIVAICCAQSPTAHQRALVSAGATLHRVSCVGNLHSSVVELLIRGGAPGVIVYGCPPRDCVGREGPKWLHERLFNGREAELQARVDRERICVATASPGDQKGVLTAFEAFGKRLATRELPEREADIDLEVVCDPIPVGEDA